MKAHELLSENDIIRGALEVLQNYVDKNPDIQIKNDVIVFSSVTKEYFDGLLDTVTSIIVFEAMDGNWERINEMRSNYGTAEHEFMRSADIEAIELPQDTMLFLDNPKQALSQSIRSLVFDYIKKGLPYPEFMQSVFRTIDDESLRLRNRGYEIWIYLSLLNAFSPHQVCTVELDGWTNPHTVKTRILKLGKNEILAGKLLPDAVITTKYQKHYAIKLKQVCEIAPCADEEKYCLLAYEMSSPKDIPVISDGSFEGVSSPSFSIEVASEKELNSDGFFQELEERAVVLRSGSGHFVAVPIGLECKALSGIESANVRVVAMDYNITELHASVSRFAPYRKAQSRYTEFRA